MLTRRKRETFLAVWVFFSVMATEACPWILQHAARRGLRSTKYVRQHCLLEQNRILVHLAQVPFRLGKLCALMAHRNPPHSSEGEQERKWKMNESIDRHPIENEYSRVRSFFYCIQNEKNYWNLAVKGQKVKTD